jgi:hypothetical protein
MSPRMTCMGELILAKRIALTCANNSTPRDLFGKKNVFFCYLGASFFNSNYADETPPDWQSTMKAELSTLPISNEARTKYRESILFSQSLFRT